MPEMPSHGDYSFSEEAAPRSVAPRSIVRHRQPGSSRAGGRNHLNNMAAANAGEAAPWERQQPPGQADILLIEHPEQQAVDAPSRTVQISMDAMRHFLTVYAMELRALRRRHGIIRIDMIASVDGNPEVVFCSIVITGESDESVRRVAEDIEDSGWSSYQADGRDIFEQDEYMRTP